MCGGDRPTAHQPEEDRYQPFHAARAELFARAGDTDAAAAAYRTAIALTENVAERRALEARAARP